MNIECGQEVLDELTSIFRYNDAIIRNLVIKRDEAVIEMSHIQKAENENRERKARASQRVRAEESSDDSSSDAGGGEEEAEEADSAE
jgi:small subunit ribosomal protein S6